MITLLLEHPFVAAWLLLIVLGSIRGDRGGHEIRARVARRRHASIPFRISHKSPRRLEPWEEV